MPYPNEHAARMIDPDSFKPEGLGPGQKFAAIDIGDGTGITAIVGVPKGADKSTVQAYRFATDKWTSTKAREWLKTHNLKPILFEEATGKASAIDALLAAADTAWGLVADPADLIEKAIWGSSAGKKHLAKRIVEAMPPHRVYVEPFAGGAQVFFAKEPSEVEVLADRDPEIAFAFKFVKGLTSEKLARLRRKSWVGDPEHFQKLLDAKPEDDVDRFYRFAYLSNFSFNKLRRGTMPEKQVGAEARFLERLEKFAPRLKDVIVRCADYADVVKEFDAPDAFFFLDPPYPGYNVNIGEGDFDEERFFKILKAVKGKFLITYGVRGKLPKLVKAEPSFTVKTIRTPRTPRSAPLQGRTSDVHGRGGIGGSTMLSQILITNYEPAAKALGDGYELEDVDGVFDLDGAHTSALLTARMITSLLHKRMSPAEGTPAIYATAYAAVAKLDEALGGVEVDDGTPVADDTAEGAGEVVIASSTIAVLAQMLYEALTQFGGTMEGAPDAGAAPGLPDDVAAAVLAATTALKDLLAVADWFAPKPDGAGAAPAENAAVTADAVKAAEVEVEKGKRVPFQQWGGSGMYASQIVDRIPEHKVYCEPFCGAAAVFYAKKPVEKEVLSDLDENVIFAHKFIQGLDEKKMAALKKLQWTVSRPGFARAKALEPRTDSERFWKHVYLRVAGYGARPLGTHGYSSSHDGQTYGLDDLEKFRDRLKGVHIVNQDWLKTVKDVDGPSTFFFLDPPYVQEWGGKKDDSDGVPPEKVAEVCSTMKGQFIVAYTDSPRARKALGKAGRIFKIKVRESRGGGLWMHRSRLFVASDGVAKSLGDTCAAIEWVDAMLAKGDGAPTAEDALTAGRALGHEGDTFAEHAKAWVQSHGLLDKDSDYDGMLGKAVLLMAETFSAEGHSGMSAKLARAYFNFLCDAWDGLHTMMLNDEDFTKARDALAKCATEEITALIADDALMIARAAELTPADLDAATVEDTQPVVRAALGKRVSFKRTGKAQDDEERYVLGVVLEPETVDSQKDVYSAETVRATAYKFMEDFRHIGLMHRGVIDERVRILESYVAPVDFEIEDAHIKKGTWLLAVRVLDDGLWDLVKRGVLTGYSIGGTALREVLAGGR